jgi:hypothetical protein
MNGSPLLRLQTNPALWGTLYGSVSPRNGNNLDADYG